MLVRTHPADIASSISVNADDEAREIGATIFSFDRLKSEEEWSALLSFGYVAAD